MNRKYGKVTDNVMEYAPKFIVVGDGVIINPSAAEYKAHGEWLPNEETEPTPEEGYHVSSWVWDTDGEKNYKKYSYEKDEEPHDRVFSKLKLEMVLFNMGLLDRLDAFVDSQTIPNELGQMMPLRRAYNTANEFSEDNQYFSEYFGYAKEALGVDDETAKAILEKCVMGV